MGKGNSVPHGVNDGAILGAKNASLITEPESLKPTKQKCFTGYQNGSGKLENRSARL